MERFYNFTDIERVRIGEGMAKIDRITPTAVTYLDERGRAASIDLPECGRTYICLTLGGAFPPRDDDDWSTFADEHSHLITVEARASVVGLRGVIDDPPWFQFLDRRRTQFEFQSRDAIEHELLLPLARCGFQTWDAC